MKYDCQITGFSSQIGTKLRDWASCYSGVALYRGALNGFAKIAKHYRGKAMQKSLATAGTNFSQPCSLTCSPSMTKAFSYLIKLPGGRHCIRIHIDWPSNMRWSSHFLWAVYRWWFSQSWPNATNVCVYQFVYKHPKQSLFHQIGNTTLEGQILGRPPTAMVKLGWRI